MYKIVFEGVRADTDQDAAFQRLGSLFNASDAQLAALLAQAPVAIKSGLDEAESARYMKLIEAAGGQSRAESERLEVDLPPLDVPEDAHEHSHEEPTAAAPIPPPAKSAAIPAFAVSIERLDSGTIKREFLQHYAATLQSSERAPRTGYGDAQKFTPDMGELAFWGRCLFYPDDPWVEARLEAADAATLQKESGRIIESQVERVFDAANGTDAAELRTLMNLLTERYNLKHDRSLFKLAGTMSVRPKPRASTQPNGMSVPLAGVAGPDFHTLFSGPRVAVLVIFAVLAWLLGTVVPDLWIPFSIVISAIAGVYLTWCYAEQDAGRLVVFWSPHDAVLTIGGALLSTSILLASVLIESWHPWLLGLAAFVLTGTLIASFNLSATSNASRGGVVASALGKLALVILVVFALFLLLARAVSKPDRRQDEGELAYQRRVDDHDLSVTLQGVATAAGIAAGGWLFTRTSSNDEAPPYQLDKPREHLSIYLALGALTLLALLYYQDKLGATARRLVLDELTAPVARADLDADRALKDYLVHQPQRLADSWTSTEFKLNDTIYRSYFIAVPSVDAQGKADTCGNCAPGIGAITYALAGKRWRVKIAQLPVIQLGQGGKPPAAAQAREMRLGTTPVLVVSTESGRMGSVVGTQSILMFRASAWHQAGDILVKEDNTQTPCQTSTCVRWTGKLRVGEATGEALPPVFVDAQGSYAPRREMMTQFAESFRYEYNGTVYTAASMTPWERDAKAAAEQAAQPAAVPAVENNPHPAGASAAAAAPTPQPAVAVVPPAPQPAAQHQPKAAPQPFVADGNYTGTLTCGPNQLVSGQGGWTDKLQVEMRAGTLTWVRAGTQTTPMRTRAYSERAQGRLGADGSGTLEGEGSYLETGARPWTVTAQIEVRGDTITGPMELLGSDGRKIRDCTVTIRVK